MKKIIALLLCTVLLLCGCTKGENPGPTEDHTHSTSPSTEPTEDSVPDNSTEDSTPDNPTEDSAPSDPTEPENTVTVSILRETILNNFYGDETKEVKGSFEYDEDYNLIGVKMYQDDLLVCEITYDKDPSRPLMELTYDDEGNELFRTEYTYNEQGNILSCIDDYGEDYYTYDENGHCLTEILGSREIHYTYNEDGNIVSKEEYLNGEWDSSSQYSYSDGLLSASNSFHGERCNTSKYDAYGNILETITSEGDQLTGDEMITYYHNIYDGDKLMEVDVYQDDLLKAQHRYDHAGNQTLYITYNGNNDEENFREEADYDDSGRLIRSLTRYQDGDMGYENTTTYYYDGDGLLACMSQYYYDELTYEYIPVYEIADVTQEQAKKILQTSEKIFLIPDNS